MGKIQYLLRKEKKKKREVQTKNNFIQEHLSVMGCYLLKLKVNFKVEKSIE